MCRHQPRSTLSDALVPYTSLFRSGAVLLPGNVVDHQQDPVEPEVVAHVDGGDEVTDVGRVEGAPEYPEARPPAVARSEEHTSGLQSLMRISYAVFCLTKKNRSMTTRVSTVLATTQASRQKPN